jgi:hypothetical protein
MWRSISVKKDILKKLTELKKELETRTGRKYSLNDVIAFLVSKEG